MLSSTVIEALCKARGYTFIRLEKYKPKRYHLHFICPKNHTYYMDQRKFKKGQNCGLCKPSRKKTQAEVAGIFAERGYRLIGTYQGSQKPVETLCPQGHPYSVCLDSFMHQGATCIWCRGRHPEQMALKANPKLPWICIGVMLLFWRKAVLLSAIFSHQKHGIKKIKGGWITKPNSYFEIAARPNSLEKMKYPPNK